MTTKNSQTAKKDERQRNFATVVYPDSVVDGWVNFLEEMHVPCLISPLHDQDEDPDGNIKKPHYHILIMFEGKKDFDNQVKPIFDSIGAVGREAVHSIRGYARYLCHLDNPEKHQYNIGDVISLSGADYNELTNLPSDNYKAISEMQQWVVENQCIFYSDLAEFARLFKPDWFRVLQHNSIHMMYFIRSLEYKIQKELLETQSE